MAIAEPDKMISCIGCGAVVPAIDGPTHAYIGASPGCWAIYGEVLAKEYSDYRFAPVHRLTVDTYAVQHPGKPERRAIQSVVVHLIGLYVTLECGFDNARAIQVIKNAAGRSSSFSWLEPPISPGTMTVLDIHRVGDDSDEHKRLVTEWARTTWAAWSLHHAQIRQWVAL